MSKKRNDKRHELGTDLNLRIMTAQELSRMIELQVAKSKGGLGSIQKIEVIPPSFIEAFVNIATNAWRAKRKMVDADTGEPKEEMKRVFRHIDAMFDSLNELGIRIEDVEGRAYDPGMALKVVAFEETPGILKDEIKETIRPGIFFKDSIIQMGEVIVGTPKR